jgi:hypothetical protein
MHNVCDISPNQLSKPCLKDDRTAIEISEDEYQIGVETCKWNLHRRTLVEGLDAFEG